MISHDSGDKDRAEELQGRCNDVRRAKGMQRQNRQQVGEKNDGTK